MSEIRKKKTEKILLTGRHGLLDRLIIESRNDSEVIVFSNKEKEDVKITTVPVEYKAYFFLGLLRLFVPETTVPRSIKGFGRLVNEIAPSKIITMEFYHLLTQQTLTYVGKNPDCQLYVLCETQRWPEFWIKSWVMKIMLFVFAKRAGSNVKILVWTDRAKDFFASALPKMDTSVIHSPVNTEIFFPREKNMKGENEQLRIICNARYAEYKRHRDLFVAVRKLVDQGTLLSITCIGRADMGKSRVEEMASENEIEHLVEFLDPVQQAELTDIYRDHDVLVLCSDNEAVGMVVPEAMACGLATITSDTVGANVYVEEGETGLIFKTGDVGELASAIEKLSDKTRAREMGQKAVQRIRKHFTVQRCTERFKEVLSI